MKFINIQRIINLALILTVFAVGVFAQNAMSENNSPRWIPTIIEGKKIKDTKAFIVINEKNLGGNGGCNLLYGTVEKKAKTIKFSDIGSTKMFCNEGDVMQTEMALMNVLEKANKYKQSADMLKLYKGKRLLAEFIKAKNGGNSDGEGVSSIKLEDKKWVLETIAGAAIPKVVEPAFIVFNKEKMSAGGNTSCNVFGADYEANGNNLKITQAIQTFRACIEDERMDVERGFMNGLRDANRYEIKGEKLYLYNAGKLLLVFRAENK